MKKIIPSICTLLILKTPLLLGEIASPVYPYYSNEYTEMPISNTWFPYYPQRGFVFVEAGYQMFHHLPDFSYASQGPVGEDVLFPLIVADDDEPKAAYVRFGAGITIPSFLTPYWLGQGTSVSVEGLMADDTIHSKVYPPGSPRNGYFTTIDGEEELIIEMINGSGDFKREYNYKGIELTLSTFYPLSTRLVTLGFEPYVALAFDQFEQDYGLDFTATDFPIYFVVLDQNLSTNYTDLGGGIKVELPLWRHLGVFVDAGGYVSYAKMTYNGQQVLFFDEDSPTYVNINDHQRHTTGKFKGALGLEVKGGGINFGVIGRYEYWGYIPSIINFQPSAFPDEVLPPTFSETFVSLCSVGFYATVSY